MEAKKAFQLIMERNFSASALTHLLSHTYFLFLCLFLSPIHCHTHTLYHSLIQAITPSLTRSHSLSLSLALTHTHTSCDHINFFSFLSLPLSLHLSLIQSLWLATTSLCLFDRLVSISHIPSFSFLSHSHAHHLSPISCSLGSISSCVDAALSLSLSLLTHALCFSPPSIKNVSFSGFSVFMTGC